MSVDMIFEVLFLGKYTIASIALKTGHLLMKLTVSLQRVLRLIDFVTAWVTAVK